MHCSEHSSFQSLPGVVLPEVQVIGVLFGRFGRKIEGDSRFTWGFNQLPGPSICPKKDTYGSSPAGPRQTHQGSPQQLDHEAQPVHLPTKVVQNGSVQQVSAGARVAALTKPAPDFFFIFLGGVPATPTYLIPNPERTLLGFGGVLSQSPRVFLRRVRNEVVPVCGFQLLEPGERWPP